MNKIIFLTGATGYLGCHLAHHFLSNGARVFALVRAKEGSDTGTRLQEAILKVGSLSDEALSRLTAVEGAIQDSPQQLRQAYGQVSSAPIDEVWHSAAIFNFKPRDKERVEATNIQGTQNMLDFAVQLAGQTTPRFFYISTAYCVGQENNAAVPEHIPAHIENFRSIYEWSKHHAEQRVQAAQKKYGLDAFVLRPSIIIGTPETAVECQSGYYQVVAEVTKLRDTLARKMGSHFDGNVYTRLLGDTTIPLNLIPIDFVVEGAVQLANDLRLKNEGLKVFNLVNEAPPSIGDIVRAVTTRLGIHGLKFVSQQAFEEQEMNPIEKLINRRIAFQAPYMHEYIHFTTDCFREFVSEEKLPPPNVDVEYLMKLD